jgi:DUF1126 PH-like domain
VADAIRFHAVFDPSSCVGPADAERVFVVSFFLTSNKIGIFEPPVPNSGILGGKFLERMQICKPGSSDPYCAVDLHVGGCLHATSRIFNLLGADEWTLSFMEAHSNVFALSDYTRVRSKAQAMLHESKLQAAFLESIMLADPSGKGCLTPQTLHV